jgi:peptidylprolyl isomerase
MSNTVKDRSGQGLPPKAERRALGKAAARKRAQQRRRRELMRRVSQIAAPIAVVAIIVGAVWLFGGGGGDGDPATEPTAAAPTQPSPPPTAWTLPAGLDPRLATKPVVTAGEGGPLTELKATTIVAGTGPAVKVGDYITVNYVGVDYDTGVQFSGGSSWEPAPQPFETPLGVGSVIAGWDQGLVGVTVGSRVQLDIPASLAYPNGGGPEGDLRFVVDILSVGAA